MMKKMIAAAGASVLLLGMGAGVAEARHGADDPAGHHRHARHGADDRANHDARDDHGRHHRHARHGADDGANHDANDDHGGRHGGHGADD